MDHYSPKSEPGSSATQSVTFPSPSTADRKLGSGSSSPVPPSPEPTANFSKKTAATQFIGHLPVARDEALKTFIEIPDNWYQYKTLGRVKELEESMICDCTFDAGELRDKAAKFLTSDFE
jgi:histone-lysine N-methyltransferase SETD2